MTKLFFNAFARVKAVFSTEMSVSAVSFGADWEKVAAAAQLERQVGSGYLTGFGGKCLPKDARMLAKLLGPDCLLRRALEINEGIR